MAFAFAELIRDARTGEVADTTPRWRPVGTVRGGLRHLALSLAPDVFGWWKIAEILAEIHWVTIVRDITEMVSWPSANTLSARAVDGRGERRGAAPG